MAVFKNMKIKIVGMFCIALLVMAFIQYVITESFPDNAYITEAFIISDDITISECIVETTACLSYGEDSVLFYENAGEILRDVSGVYSDHIEKYEPDISYTDDIEKECVKSEYEEEGVTICDVVTRQKASGNIYYHSEVTLYSNIDTAEEIKGRMDLFFSDNANDHITYIKVKAYKNGKMSVNECKNITKRMYSRLGAESISVHSKDADNNMIYNEYGYSKRLKDYVDSGKEKINVHVSISYNGQNDCSDITLGYPIINDSY